MTDEEIPTIPLVFGIYVETEVGKPGYDCPTYDLLSRCCNCGTVVTIRRLRGYHQYDDKPECPFCGVSDSWSQTDD